jgi:hypothetical protein
MAHRNGKAHRAVTQSLKNRPLMLTPAQQARLDRQAERTQAAYLNLRSCQNRLQLALNDVLVQEAKLEALKEAICEDAGARADQYAVEWTPPHARLIAGAGDVGGRRV